MTEVPLAECVVVDGVEDPVLGCKVPQLPGMVHSRAQSTPESVESPLTTAVKVVVAARERDEAGFGSKEIETDCASGAVGFCNVRLLLAPHAARTIIAARLRNNRIFLL